MFHVNQNVLIFQPRWFSGIIRPSGSSIQEFNIPSKIGRGPAFDSRLGPFCPRSGLSGIVECVKIVGILILWWSHFFLEEKSANEAKNEAGGSIETINYDYRNVAFLLYYLLAT